MTIRYRAAAGFSGRPASRKLQILVYHRVLPRSHYYQPNEATKAEFEWQMRLLSRSFKVLPLDEAVQLQQEGALPAGAACITFDDGYRDNLQLALPVLCKYGLKATFFIASGFTGDGIMFCDLIRECLRDTRRTELDLEFLGEQKKLPLETEADRFKAIATITNKIKYADLITRAQWLHTLETETGVRAPRDLMMSEEDLHTLTREKMTIGGHTVNHPILNAIQDFTAKQEIEDNRAYLQNLLQKSVDLFAYPNGKSGVDFGDQHVNMVANAGYKAAVTTDHGVSTPATDIYRLRRFTPWDRTPSRFWLRMLATYQQSAR